MKTLRSIILIGLALIVMRGVLQTHADCSPTGEGTPASDTISCTPANPPQGSISGGAGNDTIVIAEGVNTSAQVAGDAINGQSGGGDDTIIIDGSLTDTNVSGDNISGGGSGNDVIINNGTSDVTLNGDSDNGDGSGDDTIINNGTTYSIVGDTSFGNGSGDDMLINNGEVVDVVGDTYEGDATGSDTIINTGVVTGNIYGDASFINGSGSGNDTIVNSGTVSGNIFGDNDPNAFESEAAGGGGAIGSGSDLIVNSGTINGSIIAGAGNDTVVIMMTGVVGGVIDGGDDYDVLTFDFSTSDPELLREWAAQIAAANPAGGTLTINGQTYVWLNFEELTQLLVSLARINDYGDPFAAFCSLGGGLDIYATSGSQGFLALRVTTQQISSGIAQAQTNGATVQILRSSTAVLYALATGELQVNAPDGADFTFSYQTRCGDLPAPLPIVVEEVVESLIIVNRPR